MALVYTTLLHISGELIVQQPKRRVAKFAPV